MFKATITHLLAFFIGAAGGSWLINSNIERRSSERVLPSHASNESNLNSAQATQSIDAPFRRDHAQDLDLASADSASYEHLSASEYQSLLSAASAHSDLAYRNAASNVLLYEWAQRDPNAALSYLQENSDTGERIDLIPMVLKQYAMQSPQDAIDWANNNLADGMTRPHILPAVYAGIAANGNPHEALQLLEQLPSGMTKENGVIAVIQEWTNQDADAVFDWIAEQPLNENLYNAYSTAMFQFIEQQPENAAFIIDEMHDGALKNQLAERHTRYLVENQNITEALQWASTMENEVSRHNVTWIALDTWAQAEPQGALTYALEHYSDAQNANLLQQMSHNLARTAPSELADTLQAFPDAAQADGAAVVAQYWFNKNPDAAETWLYSLEDRSMRNRATHTAVEQYISHQPAKALELASLLKGEESHLPLVNKVITEWYRVDPDSAFKKLQDSDDLTYDQKLGIAHNLSDDDVIDMLLP